MVFSKSGHFYFKKSLKSGDIGPFYFFAPKKKIPLVWVVCTGSFLSLGCEILPQKEAGGDSLQQQCLGGLSPSPFDTTWLVLMYVGMGLDGDHAITSHLNSILAKGHGAKQSLFCLNLNFLKFSKKLSNIMCSMIADLILQIRCWLQSTSI